MKKNIIIAILFICALNVKGQMKDAFVFNSPNQQLVEIAVKGAFVSIERSYRIKDVVSGQLFGLNGGDVFGTAKSLGVIVDNGIIVSDKATTPWQYDSNYEGIKNKYGTALYKVAIEEGTKRLELDSISVSPCNDSNTAFIMSDSSFLDNKGFSLDSIRGTKDGWLVWVFEKNNNELAYTIIKHKWTLNNDTSMHEIEKPSSSYKLLGGIFVTPKQSEVGSLKFNLSGLIIEKEDKYFLSHVNTYPVTDKNVAQVKINEPVNITPIESDTERAKSKKNKKNKK